MTRRIIDQILAHMRTMDLKPGGPLRRAMKRAVLESWELDLKERETRLAIAQDDWARAKAEDVEALETWQDEIHHIMDANTRMVLGADGGFLSTKLTIMSAVKVDDDE